MAIIGPVGIPDQWVTADWSQLGRAIDRGLDKDERLVPIQLATKLARRSRLQVYERHRVTSSAGLDELNG